MVDAKSNLFSFGITLTGVGLTCFCSLLFVLVAASCAAIDNMFPENAILATKIASRNNSKVSRLAILRIN